jgi:hypothetical protein
MKHILIKASILVGFTPLAPLCLPLAWIMSEGRVQCSIASYPPPPPPPGHMLTPPPPHQFECPLTPLLPLFLFQLQPLDNHYRRHLIPETPYFLKIFFILAHGTVPHTHIYRICANSCIP